MKSSARKLREHLGLEEAVREIPTGSMWPLLRPGGSIRFRRADATPRVGEIWVAQVGSIHVVHRVLRIREDAVLLKGDWCLRPDGWIPRSQLLAPVSAIGHGGHWRPTNRRGDRTVGLALSLTGSAYWAGRIGGSRLFRRLRGLRGYFLLLVLLFAASCARILPSSRRESVCPERYELPCLAQNECSLDRDRGCLVCVCQNPGAEEAIKQEKTRDTLGRRPEPVPPTK